MSAVIASTATNPVTEQPAANQPRINELQDKLAKSNRELRTFLEERKVKL